MGPDFGERQYEFAVNFEITTGLAGLIVGGLPVIPTTNEEAKKGYDAVFKLGSGYLYHLQYKIPSFASRQTPKNPAQWAYHGGVYYRFSLLPDSDGNCRQHLKLEKLRTREPAVYYCAPAFYLEADFWSHVASSSVFDHSALIDIADVTLPTRQAPHSISYDLAGAVRVWSEQSEGSRRERSPKIRRRQPVRDLSPETFRSLLLDFVDALADDESIAPRVARADETSGLRASIINMRAPRPLRGSERRPPEWQSAAEARHVFAETPPDRDRDDARELVAMLDDDSVLATAARIAAIDFGLTTIAEPE